MNSGKSNSLALVIVAIFAIAAGAFVLLGGSAPAPQPIDDIAVQIDEQPVINAAGPLKAADPAPERVSIERTTDVSNSNIDDMFADQIGAAVSGKVVDSDGKAVAGAEITLNQRYNPGELMRGYTNGPRFTTSSDRNGEFVFARLAAGVNMNMWVHHPDFAPKQGAPFAALIGETQTLPTIVLSAGYSLTGIVTDTGKNPLEANVTMSMQPSDAFRKGSAEENLAEDQAAGRVVTVTADANGNFEFEKLAEGIWILRASYEGFANVEVRPIMLLQNKKVDEQKVVLPSEFIISGSVVDEQQNPIANALVSVARTSPRPTLTGSTKSDELGNFAVRGLQEGSYGLSVQAEGYSNGRSGRVDAGSSDVQVVMQNKGSVSGQVSDLNGRSISDFQIEILRTRRGNQQYALTGQRYVFTETNGTFDLPDLNPGNYILLGRSDGYSPTYSANFTVGRNSVAGIDIILEAGGTLKGIIVSSTGETISGAVISVHGQDYSLDSRDTLFGSALSDPNNMPSLKTRSNANGEFTLSNVPKGSVSLLVSHDAYLDELIGANSVSGSVSDLGSVTVYIGGSVHGVATNKDGEPMAGGTVTLTTRSESFFQKTVTLDAKGRYKISGLAAGTYSVIASAAANDAVFLFPSEADKKSVYVNVGQDLELNLQSSE
ncbi:MAG: carboxypeptidase regulatory-like domain-containing protein [Planctomycetes bacterium]|nr:carboxypeptidase regulatory-like domain-containing protein [Planctomycetota bacterium]